MRVFNVPVSVPFLRTVIAALVDGRLVEGFEARAHPERLAQATLYLPTRRAGRIARDLSRCAGARTPRCCRGSSRWATSTRMNWLFAQAAVARTDRAGTLPAMEGLERRLRWRN